MGQADVSDMTVIDLDSRRPKVWEWLICLWCRRQHGRALPVNTARIYHSCPGCDEEASLALWRVRCGES